MTAKVKAMRYTPPGTRYLILFLPFLLLSMKTANRIIIASREMNMPPVTSRMLSRYNGKTFVSMKKNNIEKITEKSAAYGSYLGDNMYRLEKIVEKPALEYVKKNPTELSVAGGIYLIDEEGGNKVGKVKKGAGGEYHITDIIDMQAKDEEVYGYLIDKSRFKSYDVGDFDVLIRENLEEKYRKDFFDYVKNSKPAVKTIFVGGVAMYGNKNDLMELLSLISKN